MPASSLSSPHYRRIAEALRQTVASGSLLPGDRMISARKLAEREQVSLPTALEALRCLEAEGLIVARPRAGYFVRQASRSAALLPSPPSPRPTPVTMSALAHSLFSSADTSLIPLGAALPDPAWLPTSALQRTLLAAGRRLEAHGQTYSLPPGRLDLRAQIAARAAHWGARFGPDDLVITAGATQAVRLALRAVCRPGDVVGIERPAYFGTLLLLEDLGLKALELPTDPREGLLLESLAETIQRYRPVAVLASPTVQNPLGASMPVARKRALVELLASAGIPLIEDDVYGDLAGEGQRPPACKAFDSDGNVLYCGSLSKTIAPGWRIGWIAAGRYHQQVLQGRQAGDWAGVPLLEAAASEVLASGDYERHLRRMKSRIGNGVSAVTARVEASFPHGTRVSAPCAGFLLWVELPRHVDVLEVHRQALALGIGVSPGPLFSPRADLLNYLRLNCANEPTPRLLGAVEQIGMLCNRLAQRHPDR
ncbi:MULTISPECIES: PLP-dependent aminotransferase family protein [unclassified Herbaspirillum]|uniref:aminotransferase-like domain-containing protein n=1 Tax=unclassified Herbaspirillum TaxID=2624150 RepID=UPI000E2FD38E|nr:MULTISPECIES: PLP-dependent aminotransferase family protein [unclassified Herbaspirillum]RFB71162.1 PLP-dependent aminotransferase family protein [Herbaspirillum sp. 3R-3a1]TFI08309.1 PLP-dependent aminotransferase family protein [Herbaspirillum sp. 3R11]TFI14724.1 PLP-dependent aminotransferase family protein [Herbaspirillum sp. 3R-11]TFI31884.1 PLP-dependent aminotransferase family protein [Herbaspirillum sp. 3C11]TFI32033.1 PLP-dependent aminotransferase family protein [Herbaspirillum sp